MTITLTPEQEAFVTGVVASGNFASADDVIYNALHLLSEHGQLEDGLPIEELRGAIAAADEQFACGEYRSFDDASLATLFEDIEARGELRLQQRQDREAA